MQKVTFPNARAGPSDENDLVLQRLVAEHLVLEVGPVQVVHQPGEDQRQGQPPHDQPRPVEHAGVDHLETRIEQWELSWFQSSFIPMLFFNIYKQK